ncbi:MAG: homoserine kinase [Candidatus Polarisedimenticolaceae bacterium]|nr:homoserine kinase [Candidatus Polarisedimenticolaceae bacterium]
MSVYTRVERDQLESFLENYSLGTLRSFQGISDGIENTNYFVTTTQGKYVLTLFEALTAEELPFFLDLMAYLAKHEVPSASPLADRQGDFLRELNGKPAALVQRLSGRGVEKPNEAQCAALGRMLGRLHRVGQGFEPQRKNSRDVDWWPEAATKVMSKLSTADQQQLQSEMAYQASQSRDGLPRGVIHADLFCDNALFDGDQLTGIIDFYYACSDHLLYDLAVTVNDWCKKSDGSLDEQRTQALLSNYHHSFPLTAQDQQLWPVMLRAAALRFWLSRLLDKSFPRDGEMTHIKDPEEYGQILRDRIARADYYQNLWP